MNDESSRDVGRKASSLLALGVVALLSLATSPLPTCPYSATQQLELEPGPRSSTVRIHSAGRALTVVLSPAAEVRLPGGELPEGWDGVDYVDCLANFERSTDPSGYADRGLGGAPPLVAPGGEECTVSLVGEGLLDLIVELPIDEAVTVTATASLMSTCQEENFEGQYGVTLLEVAP